MFRATATITENLVSENYSGGIVIDQSNVVMTRNRIIGNGSFGSGGGLSNRQANVLVADNLILNNQSPASPGIYSYASNDTIVNNTLIGNQGDTYPDGEGAAIYALYVNTVTIANNIVAYNSAGIAVSNWLQLSTEPVILANNDSYGNSDFNFRGISPGPGDISLNPCFVDSLTEYYHLQSGSPCIDAGDNAYASTGDKDLDGRPRIIDTIVDMGCYETGSVPPYTTCTLSGTAGLNDWYVGPSVQATLTASDDYGGVVASTKWAYSATAPVWNTYTSPISHARLGISNLYFYSTDLEGNVEQTRTAPIKFDNSLPVVNINSPAATTVYTRVSPITYSGTASDGVSGLLSVRWMNAQGGSGPCAGTTSWSAGVPLVQGLNRVTIWAKDNAGNSYSATRPITYDNIAPAVTTTFPVQNATGVLRSVTIRVNFNDYIQAGSAYSSITLKRGNTNITITKNIIGKTLYVKATTNLNGNANHTLTIPVSAIKDMAGNPLGTQFILNFRTGSAI